MITLRRYLWEGMGWIGALFSLLGFSLNSLNIITSQSVEYLTLNIAGCFLMILYGVSKKAHASWVLNTIWLLMSTVAFIKAYMV